MDRQELLDQLTKATDKAAQLVVKRGSNIYSSKKIIDIGNTSIEKNPAGMYDVVNKDCKKIYADITVFDVAVIIAQRYNVGELRAIDKVLTLEHTFAKYHYDMLHYLHCYKGAKKRRDYDKMYILEDKFQTAEQLAKRTRNSISVFKRVK